MEGERITQARHNKKGESATNTLALLLKLMVVPDQIRIFSISNSKNNTDFLFWFLRHY